MKNYADKNKNKYFLKNSILNQKWNTSINQFIFQIWKFIFSQICTILNWNSKFWHHLNLTEDTKKKQLRAHFSNQSNLKFSQVSSKKNSKINWIMEREEKLKCASQPFTKLSGAYFVPFDLVLKRWTYLVNFQR